MSTSYDTPAKKAPLPQNGDGPPASGSINYTCVIGMLLYLTRHSRLDCSFTTNQYACYTFAPIKKHKNALIQIGRYLKGIIDKGLTNPIAQQKSTHQMLSRHRFSWPVEI
jgi:hypothetical protein